MFTSGLRKTSSFDHNNMGLEYKMSDFGSSNSGAAGMAPTAIPEYQPSDRSSQAKGPKMSARAKARAIIDRLFIKIGSGMDDAGLSSGGGGSDIAPTTVDQLKWTSQNGPNLEQEADDRKELKNRRKAYLKARNAR
jgi:hypothetical protein